MYKTFREKNQNLPGDEEILKTQKPTIKVYLYPFKDSNPKLILPKLAAPQLVLQEILPIETLKKYLVGKLTGDFKHEEIEILFKNNPVRDDFKLRDVGRHYGFGEKNIFHYRINPEFVSNFQNKIEENLDSDKNNGGLKIGI